MNPYSAGSISGRAGNDLLPLRLCNGSCDQEPPLGAHLVSPRRHYQHHGIYVGHGRVIHYAGLSRSIRRGAIEEVGLERFAHGQGLWWQAHADTPFAATTIVQRARSRLGENRYRLLTNNCEHLCHWCLYGVACSTQIEHWRATPALALTLLRTLARSVRSIASGALAVLSARLRAATRAESHAAALRACTVSLLLIMLGVGIERRAVSADAPLIPAYERPQQPPAAARIGPLAGALPAPQPVRSEPVASFSALPFSSSGRLQRFVDSHRQGIPIATLWCNERHRLALGINARGVPGLYLLPRD